MVRNSCSSIESRILNYINSTRTRRGLHPVHPSKGLIHCARKHSGTMAHRGSIFHGDCGPLTGSYENCGMMPKGRVIGFKDEIRTDTDIARALHQQWMHSHTGHRENVLDPRHRFAGIGVKRRGNEFYATELFHH